MKTTITKKLFRLVDKLFYKAQNPPKKMREALDGLEHIRDIAFDEEGKCRLDLLYRPRPEGEKYPVVFEIHGGGFSAGDKSYRLYHCAQIAQTSGAMVVNVNHPLGPEEVCPKPLQSLVRAFNWVIENADRYNIDVNRMLVTGDSSGAYYAALLAMIPDNPRLQEVYGKMNGKFSAAVYLCGVYDVAASLAKPLPFGITTGVCIDLTGKKPKELDTWEYMKFISPMDFITSHHPKTLVIYAKKDFFAKGQAETLIEKLRDSGVECDEYHSERFLDNHGFVLNMNSRAAKESRIVMYEYIKNFCVKQNNGFFSLSK